jgi:hypothetical protein
MTILRKKDYIGILEKYNQQIPKKTRNIKQNAENIMRLKLCKCITKFNNKPKYIGICTRNIFNKRGFIRGSKFTCKKNGEMNIKKYRKKWTRKNKI